MPRKPNKLEQGEFALALMNAEVLRVLKKHRAPDHWCSPEAVNVLRGIAEGGIPRHPLTDPPISQKNMELNAGFEAYLGPEKAQERRKMSEAIREHRAHESELAVSLSQTCPEKFWEIMAAVSSRVETLYGSPEFHAAMTLALHWKVIQHLDLEQMAKHLMSVLNLPISKKTVEHAKRRALDAGLLKLSK